MKHLCFVIVTSVVHMSCMYFRELEDCCLLYLLLHFDDMLIAEMNISWIEVLKKRLSDEFEMIDLGIAMKILGMEMVSIVDFDWCLLWIQ